MSDTRRIVMETVRALCVLALLFLNFGHTQSAWPVGYNADLTAYLVSGHALDAFCAQTGQDNPQSHHSPCHACRIGAGADLPPASCVVMPAFAASEQVAYVEPAMPAIARHQPHIRGARAPPLA